MSADMRPADYDVDLIVGDDWTLVVTAVDAAGDPVDLSAATITADVLTAGATRSVVDTITDAVSGAGNNVITLSFTDTETAALTSVKYLWSLTVTISGDTRQWLAGAFNVWPRGDSRAVSTSGAAVTATVDNTVTLTVVAAGAIPGAAAAVGITDSGGYYTGTDVEAALAEIADGTTLDGRYRSGSGLLSARPAASADNSGWLYFATDVTGGTLYRSNGTSWVQVAAPVGAVEMVVATADQTVNNSTTFVSDSELIGTVEASSVYVVEGFIIYNSATTADMKIKWSIAAGASATFGWTPGAIGATSASVTTGVMQAQSRDRSDNATIGGGGASDVIAHPFGRLVTDTAGTITMQFAQYVAEVSDTKRLAGSWLRLTKVG